MGAPPATVDTPDDPQGEYGPGGLAALRPINAIRRIFQQFGYDVVPFLSPIANTNPRPVIREEFKCLSHAGAAAQKLIDDYAFETVLDIGCGSGEQAELFRLHGKKVTALDYGKSIYFERHPAEIDVIIGDFNSLDFPQEYDCVWASHVLEHQVNAGLFLKKVYAVTKAGGVACITVPPLHQRVLGGHVSLWNGGLLLYNLVLAGFDCRNASILSYDWNISVIVRKEPAHLPELVFDNGDVNRISSFLPEGFQEGFNGDISSYNW